MIDYFQRINVEDEKLANRIEALFQYDLMHRSRYSLHNALEFDRKYLNELLNREDPEDQEAIKYMIAQIVGRLVYQYEDSNETQKSWDDFIHERLGKKYDKLMSEWLMQKHNEFFKNAGMPEQMKPASIYLFKGKENEEDECD